VAAPGEVGQQGRREELENRRRADEHATGDVPAPVPAGPGTREQEQKQRVHRAGKDGVGQWEEGREHRDQCEQLGAAGSPDNPVDDQQAGEDRGLDEEQPDPHREVVRDPGQRNQNYRERRRIEVAAAQRPVPGHVVADEVGVGIAAGRDLLGGEEVILEVIGARCLGPQQGQQEAPGVEGEQDPDQGAQGNLARVRPSQQSAHLRITRGHGPVTPPVTRPSQDPAEPVGRIRPPAACGCAALAGQNC